jgi:Leu/Phe-tRNA-protein transferase
MIHEISPDMLREDILREYVYPDLAQTLYWSTSWDPAFYKSLARAGFISISHAHPEHGPILLAELQAGYAVLDWKDLHRSAHIRRMLRSDLLEEEEIELRDSKSCERVLQRLLDYHHPQTWLSAPYQDLLRKIGASPADDFALHAIELWSCKQDWLIAGEIGYSIGSVYTSLSGFTTRPDPRWRSFGTLQMVLLAERLRDQGYAFWNMGHTQQAYKLALGARVCPRNEFLERWSEASRRDLRGGSGEDPPPSQSGGA